MKAIPAIDLSEGKAVRLSQGDFARKTIYHDDPVALASEFEAAGLTALHVVDLDGARTGGPQHLSLLEEICKATNLQVDYGGGVREASQVRAILDAGGQQITVGSVAARQPERFRTWLKEFGPERFILGADARKGRIAVAGWQEATDLSLEDFIGEYLASGIKEVLCTAIERDGMLTGPDLNLYRQLQERFPEMNLIASGGVSGVEDLEALTAQSTYGVVIGKAYYEGRISLEQLAHWHT